MHVPERHGVHRPGESQHDLHEHGDHHDGPDCGPDAAALAEAVLAAGRAAGLDAVGITSAAPFEDTRRTLEERRAAGLHGGMAFTYRNPARSTDPGRALPGAQALVVGARSYHRAAPDRAGPDRAGPDRAGPDRAAPAGARAEGVVARYSWEDHYEPLRAALAAAVAPLVAEGFRTRVLVDDNALVDRAAAHRAGLGWYGKNTNLLLPGSGSWFVLGSVVTDAPLPPTASGPAQDGCGACDRCLPACPTGALVAPGVLDARRCLAWLLEAPGVFPREHRVALAGRIYGCDDCQEACPPNRVTLRRRDRDREPAPTASAEPTVDLVEMLETADDAALLARFARWYVPRRDAAYLRRNALLALANVGDGGDGRTRRAVAGALAHPSPVVRGAAVWAAARLGGFDDALREMETTESDPSVRDELGSRPPARSA